MDCRTGDIVEMNEAIDQQAEREGLQETPEDFTI